MPKKQYYINRTTCRIHNKKTAALAEHLRRYNNTIIEFDEDGGITPQTMYNWLKNFLLGINQQNVGRDVTVRMQDFVGQIIFSFYDNPNTGESVAGITLLPVKQIINDEEQL